MNQKAYHRNKISIDSVICTKSKLIFLVAIVFLFTATVLFAGDKQELGIDCRTEKSKHFTIFPATDWVRIGFTNCCCRSTLIGSSKEAIRTQFSIVSYPTFDDFWLFGCVSEAVLDGTSLPEGEGTSKDYTYECYTKEQLKTYYDEVKKFSGKPKD